MTTIPTNGCYRDPDYEPGNSTRYDLMLAKDDKGRHILCWLNAPGGGRCAVIFDSAHMDYICEKMGMDYNRRGADFAAIAGWLDDQGFTVLT